MYTTNCPILQLIIFKISHIILTDLTFALQLVNWLPKRRNKTVVNPDLQKGKKKYETITIGIPLSYYEVRSLTAANLSMIKVWLNVFPKQWEDAVNQVIQRTRFPNIMLNFGKKTKVYATNLIPQLHKCIFHQLFRCITERVDKGNWLYSKEFWELRSYSIIRLYHCNSYVKQRTQSCMQSIRSINYHLKWYEFKLQAHIE